MAKKQTKTDAPVPAGPQVRAYLAALPPESRKAAKALRDVIRAAAPRAVEHFSYGIPGFRFNGRPLAWYAGWRTHTSIYPFSDAFATAHGIALDGYETSKGTIRFPLAAPLPAALIAKLIKARLRELDAPASTASSPAGATTRAVSRKARKTRT
jgi:uncharacterized protein YdhG (YjbR/CyaY superfamily)